MTAADDRNRARQDALAALEDALKALTPKSPLRLLTRYQLKRIYERERKEIEDFYADPYGNNGGERNAEVHSAAAGGLDSRLEFLVQKARHAYEANDYQALQSLFPEWERAANSMRNQLASARPRDDDTLLRDLSVSIVMADKAKQKLLPPPNDRSELKDIVEPAIATMDFCVGLARERLSE